MNGTGKVVKFVLVGLGILVLGLLFWGIVIEPYLLDVEQVEAPVPGLPAAWEGEQIAIIGDLQIGFWGDNESTVRQAVRRIIELRPQAVLLLGDYVYHSLADEEELEPDETLREIRAVQDLLRPLAEAGIPTFAVLGGHDYAVPFYDGPRSEMVAAEVTRGLEELGIIVLRNEALPLALDGQAADAGLPLYLVGIGPQNPRESQPEQALAMVPDGAPRLVFFHNPDTFPALPAGAAPVAVAGHTHGGQVQIPFTPEWHPLRYVVKGEFHAEGWIDGYGAPGNRLYVNRGIGFSLIPIRINAPPELTIMTLTAADAG